MKCATISFPSHKEFLPVASMKSRSFNLNARFNIYVLTRRMFIMCKASEESRDMFFGFDAKFFSQNVKKSNHGYIAKRFPPPKKRNIISKHRTHEKARETFQLLLMLSLLFEQKF